MKVLHVIDSLRLAGAERLVADLAGEMTRLGHVVRILALRRDPDLLSVQADDSVEVVYSPVPSLYSPAQILAIAGHLREHEYDIIHVHLYPAQLWVAAASTLAGTDARLVTTEHNTLNRRRSSAIFRALDWPMYRRYEAICAISEATAAGLASWLPGIADRIEVVPNGVPVDRFRPVFPKPAASCLRLVTVGRCEAQKRHDVTLRAVSRVPGVHLTVIGDGPDRSRLQSLSTELHISDRVAFPGHRSDVADLLADADAYVQSSEWEGFGIAAVEAMAAGLPVIYSDVPGLRHVVDTAGIPFVPGSPESLRDALRLVASDPELRSDLSRRSHRRAGVFTLHRCVSGYLAVYDRLLEAAISTHKAA